MSQWMRFFLQGDGAMRGILLIGLVLFSGCKTVEVALTHPTTGIHFVARMESESAEVQLPVSE